MPWPPRSFQGDPAAILHDDHASADEKAGLLLGSLARRRFLAIGGLSVATAAVVAACGDDGPPDNVPQSGTAPPTTALAKHTVTDVALLRTASSLEHNAIDAYHTVYMAYPGLYSNTDLTAGVNSSAAGDSGRRTDN